MLLFGLLLLTSALAGQRPGTRAESNLSSKLQLASNKEQNGNENYFQLSSVPEMFRKLSDASSLGLGLHRAGERLLS
ncbi:hypothetical protein FD755_018023 [Muntiacus reevesi]|uniref:Uncharacterized protein n=2 Tax=Muntiacus TaxID=9885 RepID=A0A5N3X7I0_MUNRE|nr:hypothetical protein FD754_007263 [Muntiacus muntjak]KAB0370061.1 hypothetical protein FD755_018023 [Muntiacus reevesi]